MSAQLIELLCFAIIAVFLLNRLVSMLGTTTEDDPTRKNSFYGEQSGLKDVTQAYAPSNIKDIEPLEVYDNFDDLIITEDKTALVNDINKIAVQTKNFTPQKFIKSAKLVLSMTIDAIKLNDQTTLQQLVDKRYISAINDNDGRYVDFNTKNDITAKICNALTFGNSSIIKVLFSTTSFNEEWTFQKNMLSHDANWFITNIDVIK